MSLWTQIRGPVTKLAGAYVSAIAPPLAPIISGGFAAQNLLQRAGGTSSAPGIPAASGSMIPTAARVPQLMRGLGAMANWIISKTGVVTTITGKYLGVMRGTKLFRNKAVNALAKQVGIETAAVILGITVVDVAQMIFAHHQSLSRRRRHRGISGRDVKITKRTIVRIRSIEHALQGVCRPHRGGRARSATGTFVRQG
jgi:hypothetical protein